MSDQKRWFKFWHSALSDDRLMSLGVEYRWVWVALGAHCKVHGERGSVKINPENQVLAAQLGVSGPRMRSVIEVLPHIHIEEGKRDNGEFTVTFKNWRRFQEDSTVAKRVACLRLKRRGEEKRLTPPKSPAGGLNGFDTFWEGYPRKTGKGAAEKIWRRIKPSHLVVGKMLLAIGKQMKTVQWQKDDGQFIPHPSTWLNQKRWEDEVQSDKPKNDLPHWN